jgi:hypothetical protein
MSLFENKHYSTAIYILSIIILLIIAFSFSAITQRVISFKDSIGLEKTKITGHVLLEENLKETDKWNKAEKLYNLLTWMIILIISIIILRFTYKKSLD